MNTNVTFTRPASKAIVMVLLLSVAIPIALLASCGSTDVVAKYAVSSFEALVAASDGRVSWSKQDSAWEISSPGGDTFHLSSDFSRNDRADSSTGAFDARLSFDATPFLAAGLDLAKLPPAQGVSYGIEGGRLSLTFELSSEAFPAEASRSPAATFAETARRARDLIGYHASLDHYGISLGGGNMFEWAKDLATNDKDIVFVLEPAPFVAAGVNPSRVEGWAFATIETMDASGKKILVEKLLKPFDLK